MFESYHASRTFFVSGQAQHALHLGFSVGAGAGGSTLATSDDFDSVLPIFNLLDETRNAFNQIS